MTDLRYCEPCQRLFAGKVQPLSDGTRSFVHHPDSESLKASLRRSCILCLQAWGSTFEEREVLFGTWGMFSYFGNEDEAENGLRELDFAYVENGHTIMSETMILVPWKDMQDYQFPPVLSHRTDSHSALDFLLSRYHECTEEHNGCKYRQKSSSFRPLRLLHVGNLENTDIRVCDARDIAKEESYTCLSYTWGLTQPLMLTKTTEEKLRKGVAVSTLVQTFQDAIFITRKLGIHYLWIDSLCIVQDDMIEWENEASCMGNIYDHAACTIAATSAKNSEGGLFFDRHPEILRPLRLDFARPDGPNIITFHVETMNSLRYPFEGTYWCEVLPTWTKTIEKAPLNSRAWVNQERYLSHRIMHFTDTLPSWECHSYIANENYREGLPDWAYPYWGHDPTSLKRYIHDLMLDTKSLPSNVTSNSTEDLPLVMTLQSRRNIYLEWRCFRIHYSVCKMTKRTTNWWQFKE